MRLPFGEGVYSCDAQVWSNVPNDDHVAEMNDSITDGLIFKIYCEQDMRIWARMHVNYDLHISEIDETEDELNN
jgi:hypothetical protein